MKNIFKQIISDFHQKEVKKVENRSLKIELNTGKIISIIGPRRSGKSYYLFGIISDLIKSGIKKENIIFINFEDERINIDGKDLQVLIDSYLELYPDKNLQND